MAGRAKIVLGIDEAGRGPVIGPLVLCGVWVRPSRRKVLLELGVRDSKAFGSSRRAQQRRAQLALQIRELSTCVVLLTVEAGEVDRRARIGELNVLERELAAAVIEAGPEAGKIIADGRRLFGSLTDTYPQLKAMDKADALAPEVAAASIVAKTERDLRFQEIVAAWSAAEGPVGGGGYPNKATEAYLRAYFARHGRLPGEVRQSWSWAVLRELQRVQAGMKPFSKAEQLSLPSSLSGIDPE